MIALLKGKPLPHTDAAVIILVGGVGYEVIVGAKTTVPFNEEEVTLFTHLVHKEDAMLLYGFQKKEQKELFLLLLRVQGVGPKLAIDTVTTFSPSDLIDILFTRDIKRLTTVSGMGKKRAEKLIFELKDRIEKIDLPNAPAQGASSSSVASGGGGFGDALRALSVLGFTPDEATRAIADVPEKETLQTETLIRKALEILGKGS